MFYYKYKDKLMLSKKRCEEYIKDNIEGFISISEEEAKNYQGKIFALNYLNPSKARRSYVVTHEEHLFIEEETLDLIKKPVKATKDNAGFTKDENSRIPEWLEKAIEHRRVFFLNLAYNSWQQVMDYKEHKKWKINVVGLGDVGGILLTGLKLLGSEKISSLGLYDRDEKRITRWKLELGQILSPDMKERSIDLVSLNEETIFDCDMFVFCVSVGVPEIGKEGEDVRLVQFKGNAKVLSSYAKMAREKGFKGVFAVVSDPVDLLCKVAFEESNRDQNGEMDYKGLAPEQIRGYGLGVMNGRACYYAMENEKTQMYPIEGRAFGPHGEGLIIANSIENYDEKLSQYLTEKTKTANLEVRAAGFKPFIAPALSSGSLSLLSTIKGHWHYSATFIGGTFMGCRNRFINGCTEVETLELPNELFSKLQDTYKLLDELYQS